ncbi:MAG: hypothetical protein AB4050_07275 [Synechococcus sp.]
MNVPTNNQSSRQPSAVKIQLLELETIQFGDRGEDIGERCVPYGLAHARANWSSQ